MKKSSFIFLLITIIPLASKTPNILFILSDDLGYGEIGSYPSTSPHGRISTPHLDHFASQSILFTDAYAGEAVCAPSRCSLMTGMHTGHSTIRGNIAVGDFPLKSSDVTVAEVLGNVGYSTALIGKWGLGSNNSTGAPRLKGFQYYYGQLGQAECHNYYPEFIWENEDLIDLPNNKGASRTRCMKSSNTCNYTHSLFTDRALTYLKERATKSNPFFLFLSYTIPHAGGYKDTEESGMPVPSDGDYANKPWPDVEKDHASAITNYQDADIGNILQLLDDLGLSEDTIVFFSSDNGAHNEGGHNYLFFNSSGPLRGFKRSLYDGGIRTPMMVRWPNHIPAGSTSHFVWSFWDFLPTVAEFAQVPDDLLPKNLDGVSVVSTLLGKQQPPKPYLYWEFCTNNKWGNAIRLGQWKAISFAVNQPYELYDLENDVGEKYNLANQLPHIVQQLAHVAKQAHKDDPNWPIKNCVSS